MALVFEAPEGPIVIAEPAPMFASGPRKTLDAATQRDEFQFIEAGGDGMVRAEPAPMGGSNAAWIIPVIGLAAIAYAISNDDAEPDEPGDLTSSGDEDLSTRGGDFHNSVITEAAGANVTFCKVELRGTSHLTFDGVNFNLPTATKGIVIADSSDITIQNSNISGSTAQGTKGIFVNGTDDFTLVNNQITGFATAMALSNIDGLTVQGNAFTGASWDAMIAGGIHNALFADNDISLNTPAGRKHTDAMQFYNNGGSPLSDVTIRYNHIETHGSSHGIYIANADADARGASAFFHNLVIDHNTLLVGNALALAVGQTDGLTITDNTVLRDMRLGSGSTPITDLGGDDDIKGGDGNNAINAGQGLNLTLGGAGNDFIVAGADGGSEVFGGTARFGGPSSDSQGTWLNNIAVADPKIHLSDAVEDCFKFFEERVAAASVGTNVRQLGLREAAADSTGGDYNMAETETFAQVAEDGAFSSSDALAAGNFDYFFF